MFDKIWSLGLKPVKKTCIRVVGTAVMVLTFVAGGAVVLTSVLVTPLARDLAKNNMYGHWPEKAPQTSV